MSSAHDLICLWTTTGTRESALEMARAIVEVGLGACVQINEIESVYRWNGSVQNEREFRLLIKTTSARRADAEEEIRRLHPYQVPAVWWSRVDGAAPGYAQWVLDEVAGPTADAVTAGSAGAPPR